MPYQITSYELLKEMLKAIPDGDACLEWPRGHHPFGYGWVWHEGENRTAHTIAYALTFGPIPIGLHVRHRCDNPPCFRPSHLLIGTHTDNMRDREDRGRHNAPFGDAHWASKITEDQVREIRQLYGQGWNQPQLVKAFGLRQSQIGRIVRREQWKHIP